MNYGGYDFAMLTTKNKMIVGAASAGVLAVAGGVAWYAVSRDDTAAPMAQRDIAADAQGAPPAVAVQTYKPLTVEEAQETNEELPFAQTPLQVAPAFAYPGSGAALLAKKTAVDCLTAAVYYEGGNETVQGKRAIAQVILNRVRHPAFPQSICGVIYQGSERRTGCQFTFTCDGSLTRKPARASWDRARIVAVAAIEGLVEPAVGMATHYHANYVVPYWASSLDKIAAIDTHIFYNWKGSWGRRSAFRQTPAADEKVEAELVNDPLLDLELIVPPLGEDIAPLPTPAVPAMRADTAVGVPIPRAPRIENSPAGTLKADRQSGTLKSDTDKPVLRDNPS
ncbi:MAG: cell wall hydrolase [Pontixanthobacter sp.]